MERRRVKSYGGLTTCLCLVMPFLASAQQDGLPLPADQDAVVEGSNAFALDLYQRLEKREGNLFFSPASISTALAMTYAGARGETAVEIAHTMHFGLEPKVFHAAMGNLLRQSTDSDFYELREGNALWLQKEFAFLPSFLNVTHRNYSAALEHVDFAHAPEAARATINKRVEQQTNGHIKDLLPSRAIDRLTALVLTNAIYFKGDWMTPFDPESTAEADFHVTSERSTSVPFMNQTAVFKCYGGRTFLMLVMPYKGGDLSMVVFLPNDRNGLDAFEQSLTLASLTDWLQSARALPGAKFNLMLPKFNVSSQFDLRATLQEMGIRQAFGTADFSGMTPGKTLRISNVIHKAYVAVDEKGSEAAAATAVEMGLIGSGGSSPIIFQADHPFVFLIRDDRSGLILFMGRVSDPSR